MNHLVPAQAGAQLISLLVFIAIARWYVAPWLAARGRAEALIALLWIHVFRYVALQIFAAQDEGFPISVGGALEIVIGDVGGAVIAFAAIVLLRRRAFAGVVLGGGVSLRQTKLLDRGTTERPSSAALLDAKRMDVVDDLYVRRFHRRDTPDFDRRRL